MVVPGSGSDAVDAWETVRAQGEIQFAPVEIPKLQPRELPQWLVNLFEFIGRVFSGVADAMGISWPIFKWVLVGIGALLLLTLLWRMLSPALGLRLGKREDEEEQWAPDRDEAAALLEEADRLAAAGRFDEATHLLLQRSVNQIARTQPQWLGPSSTAREIAGLPALPERARDAFSTIAERVERSLFALRRLDAQDWQIARSAYADFALADLIGADLVGADLTTGTTA